MINILLGPFPNRIYRKLDEIYQKGSTNFDISKAKLAMCQNQKYMKTVLYYEIAENHACLQ